MWDSGQDFMNNSNSVWVIKHQIISSDVKTFILLFYYISYSYHHFKVVFLEYVVDNIYFYKSKMSSDTVDGTQM